MNTYKLPNFLEPVTPTLIEVGHKVTDDTINRTVTIDIYFHFGRLEYCLSQVAIPYSPTWDDGDLLQLVTDFINDPKNGYLTSKK